MMEILWLEISVLIRVSERDVEMELFKRGLKSAMMEMNSTPMDVPMDAPSRGVGMDGFNPSLEKSVKMAIEMRLMSVLRADLPTVVMALYTLEKRRVMMEILILIMSVPMPVNRPNVAMG